MKRLPFLERFWSKVDKSPGHGPWGDCWLWTAGKSKGGYGLIWDAELDAMVYAHRVAFELAAGRAPRPGLCVCHHCDVPACVNDGHFFEGTDLDNKMDMLAKGRRVYARGKHLSNSKLTESDVRAIRASTDSIRSLARRLGVSQTTIWHARTRVLWSHV